MNDKKKYYYSTLIYESLKAGLPVNLFIIPDGEMKGFLGVRIDDIDLPYFPWETFEEQTDSNEEIKKAEIINRKIIDATLNKKNMRFISAWVTDKQFEILEDVFVHVDVGRNDAHDYLIAYSQLIKKQK